MSWCSANGICWGSCRSTWTTTIGPGPTYRWPRTHLSHGVCSRPARAGWWTCPAWVGSITNTSGERREPIGRISGTHRSIYMAGAIALGALAIAVTPTASVAGVAVAMGEFVRSPEMARHGCTIRGLLRAGVADFRERGGASRTISGFGISRRWTMRSVLIELLAVVGLAFRLNRVVMVNLVHPSYFEVFRKAG